jgi:hypothetical protein
LNEGFNRSQWQAGDDNSLICRATVLFRYGMMFCVTVLNDGANCFFSLNGSGGIAIAKEEHGKVLARLMLAIQ